MGGSQTNATNVILYYLEQLFSECILKRTVEEIQTNATNGMVQYFEEAVLEGIWKAQWRKVNLQYLEQLLSKIVWKSTVEKKGNKMG